MPVFLTMAFLSHQGELGSVIVKKELATAVLGTGEDVWSEVAG